jgi:hypothetical protein
VVKACDSQPRVQLFDSWPSHFLVWISLNRTLSDAANPYLDSKRDICSSRLKINEEIDHTPISHFEYDFKEKL